MPLDRLQLLDDERIQQSCALQSSRVGELSLPYLIDLNDIYRGFLERKISVPPAISS